jgi:hypothetical protein
MDQIESARERARRIWRVLNAHSGSDVFAVAFIEKEIRCAIQDERDEIVREIEAKSWSYANQSILTRIYLPFKLITAPSGVFQIKTANGIRARRW